LFSANTHMARRSSGNPSRNALASAALSNNANSPLPLPVR